MNEYPPYSTAPGVGRPAAGGPAQHPYAQQPMGWYATPAAHAAAYGAMPQTGAVPRQPGAGMAPAGAVPGYAAGPMQGSIYPMAPGMPGAYPQQPASSGLLGFGNQRFVRGLLIGAAATYLLTNETVQRSAIKSAVKVWSMVQGGIEEAKERFQDAEAEIAANEAAKRD